MPAILSKKYPFESLFLRWNNDGVFISNTFLLPVGRSRDGFGCLKGIDPNQRERLIYFLKKYLHVCLFGF